MAKLEAKTYIVKATASSIPTTGIIVDVSVPLALYCLITATVAAGAVAAATEPNNKALYNSPLKITINTKNTTKKAPKLSKTTIDIIDFPSFFIFEKILHLL